MRTVMKSELGPTRSGGEVSVSPSSFNSSVLYPPMPLPPTRYAYGAGGIAGGGEGASLSTSSKLFNLGWTILERWYSSGAWCTGQEGAGG